MQTTEKGQSMFELMVAISVTVIVLLGLISLSTLSIKNTSVSKDISLATRYAQEVIEYVRGVRDNLGWDNFASNYSNYAGMQYCVSNSPPDWSNSGSCGSDEYISSTMFRRDVTLTTRGGSGGDIVDIDVTVSWDSTSGEKYATMSSTLTDWRK